MNSFRIDSKETTACYRSKIKSKQFEVEAGSMLYYNYLCFILYVFIFGTLCGVSYANELSPLSSTSSLPVLSHRKWHSTKNSKFGLIRTPPPSMDNSFKLKNNVVLQNRRPLFLQLQVRGGGNNSMEDVHNPIVEQDQTMMESPLTNNNQDVTDNKNKQGDDYAGTECQLVSKALDNSFPSPLRHRVHLISIAKFNVDIFLLGTAHISRDSAQDAKWLMRHIRPDCLFVELCHQRTALLLPPALQQNQSGPSANNPNNNNNNNPKKKQTNNKENRDDMSRTAALSSGLLTKIQSDYASKLNVTIGGEFYAAYQCAHQQQKEYERILQWHYLYGRASLGMDHIGNRNGCVIVLGDRPVKLTLLRAWESLRWWGKCKLVLALLWSSLRQPSMEELKKWMDTIMNDPNSDLLTKSIEELKNHFPSMERVIIQERDHYMTYKLYQTAKVLSSIPSQQITTNHNEIPQKKTIVAIVGAGHCGGIVRHFESIISKNCNAPDHDLIYQEALAALVETKRYKVENNNDVKSLTTDITQLQYPN